MGAELAIAQASLANLSAAGQAALGKFAMATIQELIQGLFGALLPALVATKGSTNLSSGIYSKPA